MQLIQCTSCIANGWSLQPSTGTALSHITGSVADDDSFIYKSIGQYEQASFFAYMGNPPEFPSGSIFLSLVRLSGDNQYIKMQYTVEEYIGGDTEEWSPLGLRKDSLTENGFYDYIVSCELYESWNNPIRITVTITNLYIDTMYAPVSWVVFYVAEPGEEIPSFPFLIYSGSSGNNLLPLVYNNPDSLSTSKQPLVLNSI